MPVLADWGTEREVGVRDFVIAWTLGHVSLSFQGGSEVDVPVKCTGEDEVVVYGEFIESLVEVAVVDQASRFVDDDEGEHDPCG